MARQSSEQRKFSFAAPVKRLARLVCLGVLASALISEASGADDLDDLFDDTVAELYRSLRTVAIKRGCSSGSLPIEVRLDRNRHEVNAWAALSRSGTRPEITINRGLVDVDAVLAFYSLGELSQRFTALSVLLTKSNDPGGSIRRTDLWSEFYRGARPSGWNIAFRSRLAVAISHEMAHHCLGHTRDPRLTRSGSVQLADEDNTVEELLPGVSLGIQDNAVALAADQAAYERKIEQAADDWAANLLGDNMERLNMTLEPAYSAIAELAILDVAGGRASAEGQKQYTHVVGIERFLHVSELLFRAYTKSIIRPAIPYLDTVQLVLECVERASDHKATFAQMISAKSTICSRVKAVALAEMMPGVLQPAGAGRLFEVVTQDGQAVPFLRRASDPVGRIYAMQPKGPTADGRQVWVTSIDKSQLMALSFGPGAKNGKFEASYPEAVVLRGIVINDGHKAPLIKARTDTGFELAAELHLPSPEAVRMARMLAEKSAESMAKAAKKAKGKKAK